MQQIQQILFFADLFQTEYDTVTKNLTVTIYFKKSAVTPHGFHFSINNRFAPYAPGQLAMIYADFSSPATPKLTAYTYNAEGDGTNCSNSPGSWSAGKRPNFAPELIHGTNDSSWIVSTDYNDTASTRMMKLVVNTAAINNFQSTYSNEYDGAKFDSRIGLWLWTDTFDTALPQYSAGRITSWPTSVNKCKWYDFGNRPTNREPICQIRNSNSYNNLSCEGTQTTLPVDGSISIDPEGFAMNFNWTTNCSNATITNAGSANPVLVLNQPGQGTAQSCSMTLNVSDGIATSSCSVNLSVNACDIDCAGNTNGNSTVDQCGVCNGNNTCIDCAGVPFGTSIPDQCGVCGGDGTTCINCTTQDFSPIFQELDAGVNDLAGLALRASGKFRSRIGKKVFDKARTQAENAAREATAAWVIIRQTVPSVITSCANTTSVCATSDFASTLNEYKTFSDSILKRTLDVIKKVRRNMKKKGTATDGSIKRLKRFRRNALKFGTELDANFFQVPSTTTSCNI